MAEYFAWTISNPEQGIMQFRSAWRIAKPLSEKGKKLLLTMVDADDPVRVKQRNYYHGVILKEIAQQAAPHGEKYAMPVWKEMFRRKHLPDKRKRVKDPMTGRAMTIRVRQSTEDLGVKKYAQLTLMVTAFAVTELGVEFSEPNIDRWIDPDTGEILQ